jgi:hypothetical protein
MDLIKDAYLIAKTILRQNYDKLILFSELLINKTIVMQNDINYDDFFE